MYKREKKNIHHSHLLSKTARTPTFVTEGNFSPPEELFISWKYTQLSNLIPSEHRSAHANLSIWPSTFSKQYSLFQNWIKKSLVTTLLSFLSGWNLIFNRKCKGGSVLYSSFLKKGKEWASILPCSPVPSPVFSDLVTKSPTQHVWDFQQQDWNYHKNAYWNTAVELVSADGQGERENTQALLRKNLPYSGHKEKCKRSEVGFFLGLTLDMESRQNEILIF